MLWFEMRTSAATHSKPIVRRTSVVTTVAADTTQHNAITSTTARIGLSTISRYSFAASAATRQASTRSGSRGRNRIATSAAAASATPLTRRVIILRPGSRRTRATVEGSLSADNCPRADAAVPALALLIREHGFDEVPAAEVRPQRVGHVDLRVRDLPEQVVADAHLTARADEEIRIRLTGRIEKAREPLFVEILGTHARFDGASCRIDDLGASAVVQRNVEEHPAAALRALDRDVQLILDVGRQLLHPADHAKADVIAQQRVQLGPQIALEKPHQRADLTGRTLPVLYGERIQREYADAETRGGLDRITDGIDAGAVSLDARQMPLRGPAAVAVHDDGDVCREAVELDLAGQRLVGVSGRNPRQEFLKRHDAIPRWTSSWYVLCD